MMVLDGWSEAAGRARNASRSAPYYLAVDRQIKSGFDSYEKAEQAALAIKQEHPRLLVSVYETKLRRHIAIEPPAELGSLSARRSPSTQRKAISSYPASATRH